MKENIMDLKIIDALMEIEIFLALEDSGLEKKKVNTVHGRILDTLDRLDKFTAINTDEFYSVHGKLSYAISEIEKLKESEGE
jgi:hypothetical protein